MERHTSSDGRVEEEEWCYFIDVVRSICASEIGQLRQTAGGLEDTQKHRYPPDDGATQILEAENDTLYTSRGVARRV